MFAPLLVLAACTTTDPGPSGDSATTSGGGTGIFLPTTQPDDPSTGSTTMPTQYFDLPAEPDGGLEKDACAAVDVLFVVDNSKSMGEYQAALAEAFPLFVDAMIDNLPAGVSLHVGLTTTDFTCAAPGDPCCPDACPIGNSGCQIVGNPEELDILKTFYKPPSGAKTPTNGGQGRLFEHDGLTYFDTNTSADPTPLKTWFTGAAVAAGEQGSSLEMPLAAAGYVASSYNSATNKGFLRGSDAVLLIIFLTNDPDASLEPVADYRAMLVTAKNDCEACILTAGLLRACVPVENQRLWQFMTSFGEDPPIWGDIEARTKYVDVVGQALASTLGDVCLNLPVG